jgi:hypothetical protein
MSDVRRALAAGLALMVVAGALVLSQHRLVVLSTSSTAPETTLAVVGRTFTACQGAERLPAGTTAIRLSLWALTGPAIELRAISAGRVVTSGQRSSGWDGETVTVPVRPLSAQTAASICFTIPADAGESVEMLGSHSSPAAAAYVGRTALPGRMRVEYLGRGRSSWLALLPSVARHMGLGRAWSGIWVVFAVMGLMLAVTGLTSRLIGKELHE